MSNTPERLPPMPAGMYDYMHDYYEGWTAIGPTPEDRYATVQLYTTDQMRSYALSAIALERAEHARVLALQRESYEREIVSEIAAERSRAEHAVFLVRMLATQDGAPDHGLDGWLKEAEDAVAIRNQPRPPHD